MQSFLEYYLDEAFRNDVYDSKKYMLNVLKYIIDNKKINIERQQNKKKIIKTINFDSNEIARFKRLYEFLSQHANRLSDKRIFNGINKYIKAYMPKEKQFVWSSIHKKDFSDGTDGTEDEYNQVNAILSVLPATIIVDNKEYSISSVRKTKGYPKSDIELLDGETPVVWLSLKKGKTAKNILQYGGISKKWRLSANLSDKDEECIDKFVNGVKELYNTDKLSVDVYSTDITNELKMKALYGSDCGHDSKYGKNNVNAIIQGDIHLKEKGDKKYVLTADFIHYNPEIPDGDYAPRFCTKINTPKRNDYGMEKVRLGIFPTYFRKNTAVELSSILDK